jgi:hypothetical protein
MATWSDVTFESLTSAHQVHSTLRACLSRG